MNYSGKNILRILMLYPRMIKIIKKVSEIIMKPKKKRTCNCVKFLRRDGINRN